MLSSLDMLLLLWGCGRPHLAARALVEKHSRVSRTRLWGAPAPSYPRVTTPYTRLTRAYTPLQKRHSACGLTLRANGHAQGRERMRGSHAPRFLGFDTRFSTNGGTEPRIPGHGTNSLPYPGVRGVKGHSDEKNVPNHNICGEPLRPQALRPHRPRSERGRRRLLGCRRCGGAAPLSWPSRAQGRPTSRHR